MGCMVIGLTGQTGAGKSTVRDYFAGQGAAVIDADAVSHDITDTDLDCLVAVAEKFSCVILNEYGKLDRRRLGRIVFADKAKLTALNKIMFPYITRAIAALAQGAEAAGAQYVVIDAAALFESGCEALCDTVVAVVADADTRLARIIGRDGLSRRDAENRVNAQPEAAFYTERSDFVIDNNGGKGELTLSAQRVFAKLVSGKLEDDGMERADNGDAPPERERRRRAE